MSKKKRTYGMPSPEQILRMAKDKSYADGFKEGYCLGAIVSLVAVAGTQAKMKKEVRK